MKKLSFMLILLLTFCLVLNAQQPAKCYSNIFKYQLNNSHNTLNITLGSGKDHCVLTHLGPEIERKIIFDNFSKQPKRLNVRIVEETTDYNHVQVISISGNVDAFTIGEANYDSDAPVPTTATERVLEEAYRATLFTSIRQIQNLIKSIRKAPGEKIQLKPNLKKNGQTLLMTDMDKITIHPRDVVVKSAYQYGAISIEFKQRKYELTYELKLKRKDGSTREILVRAPIINGVLRGVQYSQSERTDGEIADHLTFEYQSGLRVKHSVGWTQLAETDYYIYNTVSNVKIKNQSKLISAMEHMRYTAGSLALELQDFELTKKRFIAAENQLPQHITNKVAKLAHTPLAKCGLATLSDNPPIVIDDPSIELPIDFDGTVQVKIRATSGSWKIGINGIYYDKKDGHLYVHAITSQVQGGFGIQQHNVKRVSPRVTVRLKPNEVVKNISVIVQDLGKAVTETNDHDGYLYGVINDEARLSQVLSHIRQFRRVYPNK